MGFGMQWHQLDHMQTIYTRRAYSKPVPRTNCALLIKKCAPQISSGIYFLSTAQVN